MQAIYETSKKFQNISDPIPILPENREGAPRVPFLKNCQERSVTRVFYIKYTILILSIIMDIYSKKTCSVRLVVEKMKDMHICVTCLHHYEFINNIVVD